MLKKLGHSFVDDLNSYAVLELRSGFNQYLDSGSFDPFSPVSYTGLRTLKQSALNPDLELFWPYGYFSHVHSFCKNGNWVKVEPFVRIDYLWSVSDVGRW